MITSFVRGDGCVHLGSAVTCDGFSPEVPVRIQTHVHLDHMKDFERSKGFQKFIVCTKPTFELLCAEYNADLPHRRSQLKIIPADGTYHRMQDLGVSVALYPAGHMIGSAISETLYDDGTRYVYSSDFAWPLSNLPHEPDVLVVDATYGDPANIRNYNMEAVVNTFQKLVQERRSEGSIVVTGSRGRLQYALQLMVDLFDGPYLVSKHVAHTLDIYMRHQGFHTPYYELSTPEANEIIAGHRYISLIESRDKTFLQATDPETRIFLSAFMVAGEEPVLAHSNGSVRIALTDHADFQGTIELIKSIAPRRVVADSSRAGNAEALAVFVQSELGIEATSSMNPVSKEWGRC